MSDYVRRMVDCQPALDGWMLTVDIWKFDRRPGSSSDEVVERLSGGSFAFLDLRKLPGRVDRMRGEENLPTGKAAVYIGSNFAKHYYTSHSLESVPVDVFETLESKGIALYAGLDGGWASWDGRPEFSTSEADARELERVDLEALIAERRGDETEEVES